MHNLEHGYTIVWYDETIADDGEAMTELEAVGKKFPGTTNLRYKFYAAPWTDDDVKRVGPFPKGEHIAFTHWSAGGAGETDPTKQEGHLAVLLGVQRGGPRRLHDRVPLLRLPRAQRHVGAGPVGRTAR